MSNPEGGRQVAASTLCRLGLRAGHGCGSHTSLASLQPGAATGPSVSPAPAGASPLSTLSPGLGVGSSAGAWSGLPADGPCHQV